MGCANIVTTAGNDKSLSYLVQNFQLKRENIINYKNEDFIKKALDVNGGFFDIVLDLVGDKMLSACCEFLAIDGNLASVTEAPNQDDFEMLFSKNASFHPIGANAYSLTNDKAYWKTYQQMLNNFSALFDNTLISKPPITIIGALSAETVKKAHEMLENNLVQGKLVMTV